MKVEQKESSVVIFGKSGVIEIRDHDTKFEITFNEKDKDEDDFVTVVDEWCGPALFLKECWVRNCTHTKWEKIEDVKLIVRDGNFKYPYLVVCRDGETECFEYLKFRSFSPKNPPPVDWPVETRVNGAYMCRYFANYKDNDTINYWYDGRTSKYAGTTCTSADFKFLNLEPVTD